MNKQTTVHFVNCLCLLCVITRGQWTKTIFYYGIWLPEVYVTHSSSFAKPIIRSKFPLD